MADAITIDEQLECVKRELRMRERVYPRWVGEGRMTQDKANREMVLMHAVKLTLQRLVDEARPGLFDRVVDYMHPR